LQARHLLDSRWRPVLFIAGTLPWQFAQVAYRMPWMEGRSSSKAAPQCGHS
jgi:hypothetical protein